MSKWEHKKVATDDVLLDAHAAHLHYRGLREATIYQRRRVVTRLQRHTGKRLLTTTAADVEARLTVLRSAEYRASEFSHLRGFFGWAVEAGHLEQNPTARLRRPKVYRRLPRPIGEDDLYAALDGAPERVKPWLLLAGWAGLRAAEIARLRAEDVLMVDGVLFVRESKNGRDGVVPLSPWLVAELARCDLPTVGWMFPRRDGRTGPTMPWTVSHLSNEYLHAIGLQATLHMLRHRFGTQAHRVSRDFRVTQELLRHQSPNSTAIYTMVDRDDLAAAVGGLPIPA